MRVISLTDGRVCYLKPARSTKEPPPGQTNAVANVRGVPRFAVQLPEGWAAMQEADLRVSVERAMRSRAAAEQSAASAASPAMGEATPRGTGGFFARLFGKRPPEPR